MIFFGFLGGFSVLLVVWTTLREPVLKKKSKIGVFDPNFEGLFWGVLSKNSTSPKLAVFWPSPLKSAAAHVAATAICPLPGISAMRPFAHRFCVPKPKTAFGRNPGEITPNNLMFKIPRWGGPKPDFGGPMTG